MNRKELAKLEIIQNKIYTIRGVQVMLDVDLASLYKVETRILNQAVKRNNERFPETFCFQLTDEEMTNLKSQIVISSWGGRRTNNYAFTEQGVAMLSAVLKSETAVRMSIQIINAFVAMRRFISANADIFKRLGTLEIKQIETDKKIETVLNAIESKELQPKQGIFYDGQIFDAYKFLADLIKTADKSIVLIDGYIDETILTLFSKRKKGVSLVIYTFNISRQLELDLKKYNQQYPPAEIKEFKNSHDRFMIIDDEAIYHIGASLKDLGKKWFAFSKMGVGAVEMLAKLDKVK